MLTPEEKSLLQRHVAIDGDGNVVGNDNTVKVTKVDAETYVAEIEEQHITFVKGDVHQHHHDHYHYDVPPPPEGRCDYYNHVSLPAHYIPRPELLDAARTALIESADSMALTSAIQQVPEALHGMGGIGKTVLARALCDDPQVQETFSDGILWTTLGQEVSEPELRSKLRAWINALGGFVSETAPTLDQLKGILARLLAERACLFIVDDVWRRTDVESFQVGGPECRLLITTRDAEIAHGLGARLQPVDVMARDQALTLLEQWAQGKLDDAEDDLKEQVVKRVGYLPLAVKLAGEQLRRHDPEAWLARFDARRLRSSRSESVHDDLFLTFSLSLDDLGAQDRRCYLALAIFPEDESIPQVALTKLWDELAGLDEMATRDLMYDVAARALAQLEETPSGLSLTLHDLLRDFIAAELGEQGAWDAHRMLLNAYRATKEDEGWPTAPDDDYLYDHLAYHLDALVDHDERAADELRALFANDAWLRVRVSTDDYCYDGYLDDLALVWRRAHHQTLKQIRDRKPPIAIAESIHCALIQTTVNALATDYEPELVARAVEIDLWSPARGLSLLQRVTNARKRADLAVALLVTGSLSGRQCAVAKRIGLTAVRAIGDDWKRADVLGALSSYLEGKLLTQGLDTALAIEEEHFRAEALAALAPHLDGDKRRQAVKEGLNAALENDFQRFSADILASLAPYIEKDLLADCLATFVLDSKKSRAKFLTTLLPHLGLEVRQWALVEALHTARVVDSEYHRAQALAALAPHLETEAREEVLIEALDAAYTVGSEYRRVEALITLAPHLKTKMRQQTLVEALDATHRIEDIEYRAEALAALVPHLGTGAQQPVLAEALDTVRTIAIESGSPDCQANVLVALAQHLDEGLLGEVLDVTRTIWGPQRARVMASLAPQLSGDQLAEGLSIARSIGSEYHRAKALAALGPHLKGQMRAEVLTSTGKIEDELGQVEVLTVIASYLEGQLLAEGLEIAYAIEDQDFRGEALAALSPHLERDLLVENLAVVKRTIGSEYHRVKVLAALSQQLGGEARRRALEEGLIAARAIELEDEQAEALVVLAPQLEGELLAEGLDVAQAIKDGRGQAKALEALAPQLEDDLLEEGLVAAHTIAKNEYQVETLAALATYLEDETRQPELAEILVTMRTIQDGWRRASILRTMAPHLDDELLAEAMEVACVIEDQQYRVEAIAALAPHMQDEVERQALADGIAAVQMIGNEYYRAQSLAVLVPQLEDDLLTKALAVARTIESEENRAEALTALVPHLEIDSRQQALVEALDAARMIEDNEHEAEALIELVPHLDTETRQQVLLEALDAACTIGLEYRRVEVLAALVPHLEGGDRKQALTELQAAALKSDEKGIFSEICSHLEDQTQQEAFAEGLAALFRNKGGYKELITLLRTLEGDARKHLILAFSTHTPTNEIGMVLAPLISHLEADLLTEAWWTLIQHLWRVRNRERKDLLDLLSRDDAAFLRAFDLPPEAYAQIAQSIIDICTKWEWL